LEAVEKIYALSELDYKHMRQACRSRVEEKFSASQMAKDYIKVYKQVGQ
jgi:glycosyltransferase involved in cell wall biosynthesis